MGGHRYDYLAVGHVTCDLVADGRGGETRRPGGSAFYSALQAARLGLRAAIVTQGVPAEIESLLAPYAGEVDLQVLPAEHTTTLATRGDGAGRVQRMLTWAGPIERLPLVDASILHLAPVARETPPLWQGNADFVGITPQGLVREWALAGEDVPTSALDASSLLADVPLVPLAREPVAGEIELVELDPALLPARFDAAAISEHECAACHSLFNAARGCDASVAVTAGSRPTTVHVVERGAPHVFQAAASRPACVRDDLGAGDVFAAAFFVALFEGRDAQAAAMFANAAAALRIAGSGADAIETRQRIEQAGLGASA